METDSMPQRLHQNRQLAIEANGLGAVLFRKGQKRKPEFEKVAFAPTGLMFEQKVAGRMEFDGTTNGCLTQRRAHDLCPEGFGSPPP